VGDSWFAVGGRGDGAVWVRITRKQKEEEVLLDRKSLFHMMQKIVTVVHNKKFTGSILI
jgi:hypothetical protein